MIIKYYPILFFSTWLFSWIGTKITLSALQRCAVMDMPNERSNHKVPVPRGGGIAMVVYALVFLSAFGLDTRIMLAATLLATISFLDDLRGLSVRWRLLAQAIAVTLAVSTLEGRILPDSIPPVVEWVLTGLCWIWFINLTNFMDGIDGITSMQTIMMMVGVCMVVAVNPSVPVALSVFAIIIAAATLGFYWFNRSPARVFMGDVGSITLGFLIFYLLVSLALNGALLSALILPAYYVSDASFTLLKRLMRGEKIWQAHSSHAYQQAVRNGLTHAQVVRKITILNAFLVMLAIFATAGAIIGIVILIIAYAATACMVRELSHNVHK